MTLAEDEMRALREFFRAERDEELGRWRWPENPEYVVYPKHASEVESEPGVRVVNEVSGRSRDLSANTEGTTRYGAAALQYFAAHPEPKPWHDAKPGEVWELTTQKVDDRWNPAVFRVSEEPGYLAFCPVEPEYSVSHLGAKATVITAARRIWPEVSDVAE